ncbi:MAG: hypothetical protein COT43_04840 [Candidatus Marinimicrobia bacterium CG08_land_8_20_14_0_20_45_22]|nr:MAG: hypothetical protein COT43_04840 [Candidatus Marinimicrobia bacterium CG08_land_8_20_14_0_20_45_22]
MKIARKMTLSDIQAGVSGDDLSLENLVEDGRVNPASNFFLGVFSQKGLHRIIQAFGLVDILHQTGLDNITIDIDTSDPHTHRLYTYTGAHQPENIICELVLKQGPLNLNEQDLSILPEQKPNLLQVEWLLLQNPKRDFSDERPPLPGQMHPGLGIGDRLLQILIIMTRRLRLEGMVNKPRYFHTAFMFTKGFSFVNPQSQAQIYAISKSLLPKYSFYTVAWAAHFNCIVNEIDNSYMEWKPDYLLFPLSKDYIKYFRSKPYLKKIQQYSKKMKYTIDTERFARCMQKNNLKIYDSLNK